MRTLVLILAGELLLGALFAFTTPAWMNPDEPAHYNAIAEIVATRRLPVLDPGDYDHERLTRAVASGFPDGAAGAFLHYEDHQPPLYYLLLAPVFALSGGSLRALRLCGVALGALLPAATWATARRLLPEEPSTWAAAAAFVAFLPQALSITAAVNNDGLANPLVALGLLLALREQARPGAGTRLALGILTGLALLTKLTALPLLPVAALAMAGPRDGRGRRLAAFLGLVALLLCPMLVRNARVYGAADPLALARHAAVVAGEPTTGSFIAAQGARAWGVSVAVSLFRSFWAQFGWMSVVVDFRFVLGAAMLTAAGVCGLVLGPWPSALGAGTRLLVVHVALVAAGLVVYNLEFVQPQGRYLFPALLPIGIGLATGLLRLARPDTGRRAARAFGAAALLLVIVGLVRGDVAGFAVASCLATGFALVALDRLSEPWRKRLALLPVAALPFVSAYLALHG